MKKKCIGVLAFVAFVSFCSCADAAAKVHPKQFGHPALARDDFNRLAVDAGLPLFWKADANRTGTVEPGELIPVGAGSTLLPYVGSGFTQDFRDAYARLVDMRRRETVKRELDFGYPTLLESDFRRASASDREVVGHVVAAGRMIEELYGIQNGSAPLRGKIPADDTTALALFYRNQGPWCEAPKTQEDPFCNAIASFPPKLSDAYPEGMVQDEAMCKSLRNMKDGKKLLDPFTVVRREGGRLSALPLTAVYGERMKAVASELRKAADALGKGEEPFKKYLLAAANGFETNSWEEADEAWVGMTSKNSRWYLRVAPDETYFDPCQEKAGFHVSFGKSDLSAVKWAEALVPFRQEMENEFAKLVGDSYKPREVKFSFPDFVEIVLNSGDARHGLGATIGQTLPNWGKVAEENRRRIMVTTNIYTDPDSKRMAREKAATMFDAETMRYLPDAREPALVNTMLHEAAHNIGPHSDTKWGERGTSDVFGGRNAQTLEELKAQTGALWYIDFLRRKGLVSDAMAKELYADAIAWCLGHISRGMFTSTGNPMAYSQLAAIQVGSFVKDGAIEWREGNEAGSGQGRFHINFDKMPGAVENLMRRMGTAYASADSATVKKLIDDFVSGENSKLVRMKEIEDRFLKFPKQSFYYSVLY